MTDASTFVAALSETLKLKAIPLSGNLKARYGKEFKDALNKGVEESKLYAAIERISERWEATQLTVSQALRDVNRGKSTVSQTPDERQQGYEHLFKLTPHQMRIMERIAQIGKDTALAGLRSSEAGENQAPERRSA